MEFEIRLITDDGTAYTLSEELTVGRSDDCDITLPSSKVSRQHARFQAADGGVTVEDLGSSNGTRLNGRAIGGVQALMDGDSVTIDAFTLTVAITSPAAGDDATVIAPAPDADATVLAPAAEKSPPPAAEPSPLDKKPAPAPEPAPAAPPAGDLPGSWVDSGTGESTQFLSPDALAAERPQATVLERHSPLAHFVVITADGSASDVFELETGDADENTWELGRDDSCDIQLNDPTVSARHAQLVQRGGRWRMVNLISSNGILVNGEKRLSVYLDGGDSVQLGEVTLVFQAPEGGVAKAPQAKPTPAKADAATRNRLPLYIGGAIVVAALVLAGMLFL
ncbi:MAG: FHA domain-containing protein [Chromatocurvus sp.]